MEKVLIKTFQDIKGKDYKNKLFLGNHCNSYDYKENKIYDFEIKTKHYWDDYNTFIKDNEYLEDLYQRLLENLSTSLNKFHKCNKSNIYWEIILGPWLICFCTNIYDRWNIINELSFDESFSTEINESLEKFLITNNLEEYRKIILSETYNHYIFSKILIFLESEKKLKIKFFKTKEIFNDDILPRIKKKNNGISYIKKVARNLFIKLFQIFSRKQKISILRNYLNSFQNLKLSLMLFQFPTLYPTDIDYQSFEENKKRNDFKLIFDSKNLFEHFLVAELNYQLPKVFIEKFEDIQKTVAKSNLPQKPKIIFVTNFYNNSFISFYCAEKKEKGAKLILCQHGGCYGQYDKHWAENFEIKISNKFLTFGWTSSKFKEKTYPFGMIKNFKNSINKNFNNNDRLLFIVRSRIKFINKLDSSARSNQNYDYLNNCFSFLGSLNENLKNKILVRLRDIDLGWSEHPRFLRKFPNLKYDFGTNDIFRLMKSSKIVVSTSLSTSYLESLSMNIPTVVISNYDLEPIRKEAKEYLDLLIKSKILHFSAESATKHIEKVWSNVDAWWLSKEVQDNVNKFCSKYAKKVEHKETEIVKLIYSSLKEGENEK